MWSGWFSTVILPSTMSTADWMWRFEYANGQSDVLAYNAQPLGSFLSATLTQNLTVVPEPGTLVLLLTGGLGLALAVLRRRRRR